MSDLKKILERKQAKRVKREPKKQPSGNEAGFRIDPDTREGEVAVNVPAERDVRWDEELEELGVDPELFEVLGTVEVRTWDMPIRDQQVEKMRYVKAKVGPRVSKRDRADVSELLEVVNEDLPSMDDIPTGESTQVLNLADWQIGKAHERRGGTPETKDRVLGALSRFKEHVLSLRKVGVGVPELIITGMGDVVEQCDGSYDSQAFTTDLNLREQKRVARHLLTRVHRELAPMFERVVSGSVISNHGENRRGKRSYTTPDDNLDLEVWENLAEIFAENEDAYGHMTFVTPEDPYVLTLNVHGHNMAWTHGHQVRRLKSKPVYGVWNWWRDQVFGSPTGQLAAGECEVLTSAHFHHHFDLRQQGRVLLGCPAMDGGSEWITTSSGIWSAPSTLTYTVTPKGVERARLL